MFGRIRIWFRLGFSPFTLVKMEGFQQPIDLDLWLDAELIRRQNLLKRQFLSILEEVASSLTKEELQAISQNSRGVKISKGNDLLGFPYQVLDLIRDFDQAEGMNIRLLNWIGVGFFITILIGKNKENPIEQLLKHGFSFGLSESQWDYPDLILNQNTTQEVKKIQEKPQGFSHWIRKMEVNPEPQVFSHQLLEEVKKMLGILRLPKE